MYAINPKQLDRFRDRHTVAGAKDDRRRLRTCRLAAHRAAVLPGHLAELDDERVIDAYEPVTAQRDAVARYLK